MPPLRELVRVLCTASERAALIARTIRTDADLLRLLIREKSPKLKGPDMTLTTDLMTLADVLIQNAIRREILMHFPEMASTVFGEEQDDHFSTSTGENVAFAIGATAEDTRRTLLTLLEGHEHAATVLANIVHCTLENVPINSDDLARVEGDFDSLRTGVWIDPIDATSSYTVEGGRGNFQDGIAKDSCLPVVTVLIGAFDLQTGTPLCGVVNQPFSEFLGQSGPGSYDDVGTIKEDTDDSYEVTVTPVAKKPVAKRKISRTDSLLFSGAFDEWTGRCLWGVAPHAAGRVGVFSQHPPRSQPAVPSRIFVHSKSESKSVLSRANDGIVLRATGGAGYKLLLVCDEIARGFFLTGGSTYKWDTCGPHAILMAMGGNLLDARSLSPVLYHQPDAHDDDGPEKWANKGGLLAFVNGEAFVTMKVLIAP
eukprot:m.79306 g.79306  ORF g.79306 m.79306 type:complete len:425 (-) comp14786_c0_seq2:526-1800(-)